MPCRMTAAAVAPLARGLAVLVLTCGHASSHGTTVDFDCARQPKVTVGFVDDRAEVTLHRRGGRPPRTHTLQQQPWASGFKYAGEGLVLVGSGDRIDLTSEGAGDKPRHCRAVRRPSSP